MHPTPTALPCFCPGPLLARRPGKSRPPVRRRPPSLCAPSPACSPPRSRRAFLSLLLAPPLLPLLPPAAARAHTHARGVPPYSLPSVLRRADLPEEWPFDEEDFQRVDSRPDSLFYSRPRIGVRHIDEYAVDALRQHVSAIVQREEVTDVLDLCASAESYLPEDGWDTRRRVAGLGMNSDEMEQNFALSEWVVVDLNEKTGMDVPGATESPSDGVGKGMIIPYLPESFDLVILALSIDYLTSPRAVVRDVARVLRPGGLFVVAFSDRLFATKAVSLWTGENDAGRVEAVSNFIAFSGGEFDVDGDGIQVLDLSPRMFFSTSDPLYVVQVRKQAWSVDA